MTTPVIVTNRSPRGRQLLASLVLLLGPLGALVAGLALRDRLPEPLPRHWNLAGDVDGTTGFVAFTSLAVGATAVLTVVGLLLVWTPTGRKVGGASAALTGCTAWFLGVLYTATLVAALDAGRAEDVALPLVGIVVALVASGLVGLALARLLPTSRGDEAPEVAVTSTLALAPGEKVAWVGSARSSALAWIGVLLSLAGAVTLLLAAEGGLVLLLVGPVMIWMHTLTTRVDDRGLHVSWGPARWPGSTVALEEITAVTAVQARPGEWGGWGFRQSTRGTAHLVRAGEAIVVSRRGRRDLLVTVDGATQAREVLAALVERRGAEVS